MLLRMAAGGVHIFDLSQDMSMLTAAFGIRLKGKSSSSAEVGPVLRREGS